VVEVYMVKKSGLVDISVLEKCFSLTMRGFQKDGARAHAAVATVDMLQGFLMGPHFQKY
jgi:hypothetical protein